MTSSGSNTKSKNEHLSVADDVPKEDLKSVDLLGTIDRMETSLEIMRDIIQKANFIALNASIEAARTQSQTENFSLVADQVKRQAERTEELSDSLGSEISELRSKALQAVATNYADISNDVIDKIDRNLFERNCDMQAWAGFSEIVRCVTDLKGRDPGEFQSLYKGELELNDYDKTPIKNACEKLETLAKTYNVYVDLILINNEGNICGSAYNHNLIGMDASHEECFKKVIETKDIYVTDMGYDNFLECHTVAYTAPILDENNEVLGMVSNRFNWDFVQDIVDKMPVGPLANIFIISEDGIVLSSRNRKGILSDSLSWAMAGEHALNGESGYTIECARNGQLRAWGFTHTFGYNAYPGKKWSALVSYPIDAKDNVFVSEQISRDAEITKEAAPEANRSLEKVSQRIQKHVKSINTINNETNMLAVNASIQAGVAGAEGEAFSVIASEIGQLAKQSEEFVKKVNFLTRHLEDSVSETVFNRLGEASFDCIDKIDRNLFERNCDVQAFATFHEFVDFLVDKTPAAEIISLLRKLHEIYEVYHEIMILDTEGNIMAAAIQRDLVGQNQSDRQWFREAVSDHLVVTDFYRSDSINEYTVTYAAPIKDANENVVGVLTTRFNCEFIYDIMKATIVGNEARVYLINSKGLVIGSPEHEGILEHSFAHLKAYKMLSKNSHGHTIEEDPKDENNTFTIGYAKTQGYINYKGKGWSVIIKQSLKKEEEKPLLQAVSDGEEEG